MTGPLTLYSHMTLTTEEGATIRFIADPQLYPPVWTRWEGLNAMRCTRFCTPRMPATLPFAGRGD
ncbi:hypothetical protein DMH27_04275 [Raoultella planticola]|nr:hypothetical protein [Raoultella planticola]